MRVFTGLNHPFNIPDRQSKSSIKFYIYVDKICNTVQNFTLAPILGLRDLRGGTSILLFL